MTIEARCVVPVGAKLGESALWHPGEGRLYWLDLKAPSIRVFDPATARDECWMLPLETPVGCLLRRPDGFLLAARRGVYECDFRARELRLWFDPNDRPVDTAFNDGKADRFGHAWLGTSHLDEREPVGKLYRVNRDGTTAVVDAGFPCANGPAFSLDGRRLYFADTVRRRVYLYDLEPETGIAANRRLLIEFTESDGQPDGMTVDDQDGLWVCHWGGWAVSRYEPDGRPSARIELPVPNVTSCAFGGEDLSTLYITTASVDMAPADATRAPLAGGLFAARSGYRGMTEPIF